MKNMIMSAAVAVLGCFGICQPASAGMKMEMDSGYGYEYGKASGWEWTSLWCETDHDFGGDENPWTFEDMRYPGMIDCGVAIPVTGCGVDRIKAVVINGSATSQDGVRATVLTDYEMAKRMGIIDYWDKFEYDNGELEYEGGKKEFDIAAGVWVDGNVQSDRQWILVSTKNIKGSVTGFWTPISFSVGIVGTDIVTPQITIVPHPEDCKVTAKDFWGLDVKISRYYDDPSFSPSFDAWEDWWPSKDYFGSRVYYVWDSDAEDIAGAGELTVTAPGKGRLYCRLVEDWYPGEYPDDAQDIEVTGGQNISENDTDLLIDVSKAGAVKISGFEEKLCAYGLWFKPDSVDETQCVAVEALYNERMKCANDRGKVRLRCHVTGMGVVEFGKTIEIVCHPNEGEVFDHWEFVDGNCPQGTDIYSTTLRIESSKALRDSVSTSVGGLKVVQVRPILKPKRTIMVVPLPAGTATVVENGAYVEGEEVTITLKPRKGCEFIGWADGDDSGLTRTFTVPEDEEMTIVYAQFSGTPQFGVGGSYGFSMGKPVSEDASDLIGYSVKGLPAGMKFDPATGEISGVPTKPGLYDVIFTKKDSQTYTTTIVVSGLENEEIWKYEDDGEVDGAVMITGFKNDYSPTGPIFVPGELGGKKVVRLCDYLFDDYDDVKTIVVADSIKYIEECALYSHAERIILPSSIDCGNLRLEGLYQEGSWTDTSWINTFFNMNHLKKIEFAGGRSVSDNGSVYIKNNMLLGVVEVAGEGITTNLLGVCGRAFEGKQIIVPDGVTGILCASFEDGGYTGVSFPSSLRALGGKWGGGYCFGFCENLKRVEVRGEGSPYKVIGGSLVDTRTRTLVLATTGTEIPNDGSVESISVWAFNSDVGVKLVVPSNVTTIARGAFANAWRVQMISIGAGTTNIHGGAFTSLYSLKGFYIDAENPVYEVVNGCIIDKRNNMLVSPCYGKAGGEICEVPYFCTSYADCVFKDEYDLPIVTLPKNMTHNGMDDEFSDEGFAVYSDIERIIIADCNSYDHIESSTTYNSLMEDYDFGEHMGEWQGFSYTSLPQVAVRCRGRVMAKGFGRYEPGSMVKLTATVADKGYGVRWLDTNGNVVGTKNTLTIEMPNEDICYTVEPVLGNGVVLKDEIPELTDFEKAVIPVGHCVDGARGDDPEYAWTFHDAASVKVSGLPTGISCATVAVPGGIWLKLADTATKVGVYKVSFVASYADKTKKTSEKYFVVTEDQGKYIKIFDGATTTEKLYAAGAKVTLSPKGPKGTYFAGWYTSPDFLEESKFTALWDYDDADYRSAKFFIRRPGQIDPDALYARFITKNEDSVCEISFECGEEWHLRPGDNAPGVYHDPDVNVESETAATVSAKGLPKGISFKNGELLYDEAKIWPGRYTATFTAKNLSGGTDKKDLRIIVPNKVSPYLPNLDTDGVYSLNVGVSAAGWLDVTSIGGYAVTSISGLPSGIKAIKNKATGAWTVAGVPIKPGDYTITITAKSGKVLTTATVSIKVDPLPNWAVGTFNGGGYYGSIDEDEPDDYGAYHTLMTMSITANGKVTAKCTFDDGYVEGWKYAEITEVATSVSNPYVMVRLYNHNEYLNVWAKIQPSDRGYGTVTLWNDGFKNEIKCPMEWFVGVMEQNVFLRAEYKNVLTELGVVGTYANLSDDGFKTHPGGGGGIVDATLTISVNGQLKLVGLHEPNWDVSDPAKKITAIGTLLPSGIGYVMATDRSERYCYFAAVNVKVNPLSSKPVIEISSWVVGEEYFGRWVDGYENGFNGNIP